MGEKASYDLHVKLLMLGDTGVGKTCLLLRYAFDSFSPTFITTIGIDFKIKEIELDGLRIKLQIWDTAGQERFRTITVSYFKGAHGILLVYDVTDRESFENIQHWFQQIRENADERVRLVLVGNKCDHIYDTQRAVSKEEGEQLAKQYGVSFFETSAKENLNVDECYTAIARETKDALIALEQERTQRNAANAPSSSKHNIHLNTDPRPRGGCQRYC
mmetsp:Transcript_13791/g.18416  ORF Transcript_13791/g.18416 Transcript_13791/m.18416 type:complete len:217 (+) Transcript_13791:143-793(+)